MIKLNNVFNNQNMKCIAQAGQYYVYEHQKDMSVAPHEAATAYFMNEMNVRKRQVLVYLNNSAVRVQAGAMQWMAGAVDMDSDVKGVGNLFGKMAKGMVTGESAVKPMYKGVGYLMLEPTYHYLILEKNIKYYVLLIFLKLQLWEIAIFLLKKFLIQILQKLLFAS